jgi:polyphosphate kinase
MPPPNNVSGVNSHTSAGAGARRVEGSDCTALHRPGTDPPLFFNRELSWLAFNERVLNEAEAAWPLLERLKFLAIFFSNLDEFFMIRVAGLHHQASADEIHKSIDGLSAHEQLVKIRATIRTQLKRAGSLLNEDLLSQLEVNHIRICRSLCDLHAIERERVRRYFRDSVFPVLTPLVVDPVHPFPFLSNLSLSLAVEVRNPETDLIRFARVKVPEILPRFVRIETLESHDAGLANDSTGTTFVALEDLIRDNLADLFPGMEILNCYPFRVTRDMDLEILEEEAGDLLATINRELQRRKFGDVVRLELPPDVPEPIRSLLADKLELDKADVFEFAGPLGASALMSIAQLPYSELHDPPFTVLVPSWFSPHSDTFSIIASRECLLHVPYESFAPITGLLHQASEDPNVLAIKMTLYRSGPNPELIEALIQAAENGKQVAVCVELKARFDEESNITWAQAMERAGVHVFYGAQGLKTHAKVLLIVRREGARIRRYVHMSTGNYNATTARIYTDVSLFTADSEIGEDASEFFNRLSGFSKQIKYRRLEAGPRTLGEAIIDKIERQADLARAGKPAHIFAKMNALVDEGAIEALYRASRVGVEVHLCIRGICCLKPGVPEVSENIHVFSVVGRFLEHSRVFIFGPEGDEEIYLSSADWMPRNFYNRIELMFPVTTSQLRQRIYRELVIPLMTDNCRAYDLQSDGTYRRRTPAKDEEARDAQRMLTDLYASRQLKMD